MKSHLFIAAGFLPTAVPGMCKLQGDKGRTVTVLEVAAGYKIVVHHKAVGTIAIPSRVSAIVVRPETAIEVARMEMARDA